jgi:hypothetical protein
MASRRNHSLLCEPSAGLFVVASLITSLILISAWTALGIERGDGGFPDRNNDAGQSFWSLTTLAASAVLPARYHLADSRTDSAEPPDSAESGLRQGANELNLRGGASESRISGAAHSRPEGSPLLRSQKFQAAMLQIMTSLHDTPH